MKSVCFPSFSPPLSAPGARARRVLFAFALAFALFAGPGESSADMGMGLSLYSGSPYYGHSYYGRPYHRGYHGRHPYYRRHRGFGSWVGLGIPVYPTYQRRYYEQGSFVPSQPGVSPDAIHREPVPFTYPDQGLGLGAPEDRPAGGRQEVPAFNETTAPSQPTVYPVMTLESREAWNRYQRWVHGGVPVR